MLTLFGKLTEHGNELKRLEASESNAKRKDKNKEERNNISIKALTSKVKIEEDEEDLSERRRYEIFFVRRYKKYIRRNGLKNSDKNPKNFIKSNHSKK